MQITRVTRQGSVPVAAACLLAALVAVAQLCACPAAAARSLPRLQQSMDMEVQHTTGGHQRKLSEVSTLPCPNRENPDCQFVPTNPNGAPSPKGLPSPTAILGGDLTFPSPGDSPDGTNDSPAPAPGPAVPTEQPKGKGGEDDPSLVRGTDEIRGSNDNTAPKAKRAPKPSGRVPSAPTIGHRKKAGPKPAPSGSGRRH